MPKKEFVLWFLLSDASGLVACHDTAERKELAAFLGIGSTSTRSEMMHSRRLNCNLLFTLGVSLHEEFFTRAVYLTCVHLLGPKKGL